MKFALGENSLYAHMICKWDFKPQISSIFNFEYVNEVWISVVLGVKELIIKKKKYITGQSLTGSWRAA